MGFLRPSTALNSDSLRLALSVGIVVEPAVQLTPHRLPPPDVLTDTARRAHRQAVGEWVADRLAEWFDTDRLVDQLAAEYETTVVTDPADPAGWVATRHAEDQSTWWRHAVNAAVRTRITDLDDQLRDRLTELLNTSNQ